MSCTKNGVFFTTGSWEKHTIFGAAQTKLGPSYFVAALVIPYKAKAEGLKQGAISFKEEVKQCARKHRIIDFKGLKFYHLSISIAFNILSYFKINSGMSHIQSIGQ